MHLLKVLILPTASKMKHWLSYGQQHKIPKIFTCFKDMIYSVRSSVGASQDSDLDSMGESESGLGLYPCGLGLGLHLCGLGLKRCGLGLWSYGLGLGLGLHPAGLGLTVSPGESGEKSTRQI